MTTENRQIVCAWCSEQIRPGFTPASHGLCDPCRRAYYPEDYDPIVTPSAQFDVSTWQSRDWIATIILAATITLLALLFFACGGSPTQPRQPICVLVHHPDETSCSTVFPISGPPILVCSLTPAHDGPDQVCQ